MVKLNAQLESSSPQEILKWAVLLADGVQSSYFLRFVHPCILVFFFFLGGVGDVFIV